MKFYEIMEILRDVGMAGIAVRFALALLCGGVIGLERESKRRSAGFRTHTLVCIGATITTLVGLYLYKSGLSTDPTRLGAQVISGMGFIGAGTIIVTTRRQVKGLTTAAGLWTSAIIGLAIGAGYYEAALIGVAIVLIAALLLSKFEYMVMASAKHMNVFIEFESMGMLDKLVEELEGRGIKVSDIEFTKQSVAAGVRYSVVLSLKFKRRQKHGDILNEIGQFDGIFSVEEL
ncbi:MAG: MgtC/SapB family protein [Eubacteriales bacterium]